MTGGLLDPSFGGSGIALANGATTINNLALQSDGKVVIVGQGVSGQGGFDFEVERLKTDGTPDASFGTGGVVLTDFGGIEEATAVAIQPLDGKIVVAGTTTVNNNFAVARYNPDGTLDATFGKSGQVVTSFSGFSTPKSIVIQPNGQIIVAGSAKNEFAMARYNSNGSPDIGFGSGGTVLTPTFGIDSGNRVLLQSDGKILLGGSDGFKFVVFRYNANGTVDSTYGSAGEATASFSVGSLSQMHDMALQTNGDLVGAGESVGAAGRTFALARWDTTGKLDPTFGPNNSGEVTTSFSVSDAAFGVIIQTSGKIVAAGSSVTGNTVRLARYLANGAIDTTFGTNGSSSIPNGVADAIVLQPDNKAVIAGSVSFGGAGLPGAARYFLGNPAGDFDFSQAVYVGHDGSTATITVNRDSGALGAVTVHYSTSDGTATNGVQYTGVSGTLSFPAGVTKQTFNVPLLADGIIDGTTTVNLTLSNPTGGATLGDQPTAVLDIIDAPGSLQFSQMTYDVTESAGSAIITVTRQIGDGGPVSVDYSTSDGSAQAGIDYVPASGTLNFADGQLSSSFVISLISDPAAVGTLSVNLQLSNPTNGASLGSPSTAQLNILVAPGDFVFDQANFSGFKSVGVATITVDRENGSDGPASVDFVTSDGTAKAGVNYVPTIGTLSFAPGQTSATFDVQLLNDMHSDGNLSVNLTLTNPLGGATLGGRKNAILIIVDAPGQLQVGQAKEFVQESSGVAFVPVTRTTGVGGVVSVDYTVTAGTAVPGVDFTPSSGTLMFAPGQQGATIQVPILDDGKIGGGNRTFLVTLSNPTGGASLGAASTGTVTILDDHPAGPDSDFTGAGKAGLAVFRPTSPSTFFIAGVGAVPLGQPGVLSVPGYYDAKDTYTASGTLIPGNHKAEAAVYDPTTGIWTINGPSGVRTVQFGQPLVDIPVPADYDGDGQTDLAVYRPTTGQWFILNSTLGAQVIQFGTAGLDEPVPGDYEGRGRAEPATYRPSSGLWQIDESTGVQTLTFGIPGLDRPVPSDFDGDGKTDLALYRQSTAQWIVIKSSGGTIVQQFGQPGVDVPLTLDFNGDGKTDFAVFRPGTANWYFMYSGGGGFAATQFGQPGVDIPAQLPISFGALGPGSLLASNITGLSAGGSHSAAFTPTGGSGSSSSGSGAIGRAAVLANIPSPGDLSAHDAALETLGQHPRRTRHVRHG